MVSAIAGGGRRAAAALVLTMLVGACAAGEGVDDGSPDPSGALPPRVTPPSPGEPSEPNPVAPPAPGAPPTAPGDPGPRPNPNVSGERETTCSTPKQLSQPYSFAPSDGRPAFVGKVRNIAFDTDGKLVIARADATTARCSVDGACTAHATVGTIKKPWSAQPLIEGDSIYIVKSTDPTLDGPLELTRCDRMRGDGHLRWSA